MKNRLLLCFLILSATFAGAQTETATLRGIVTDPSNLNVPGAEIVLTDLATNQEVRRVLSDGNGNFEIPALKPGLYRVKVDLSGFRSFIADSLKLDPGQIRRLDIALQVGTTAETVTVTAGAAVIQTETGTISGELDQKKFLDRPLVDVYPSPLALMTTMPGIQGNGWNIVMSGISDRNKQTWAMDGIANDTMGDQNDNPAFFETVQVTPVNGGADSARAANFNMVSKRGTDIWHAAAFYKHENAGLNAREYFSPKKTPYILHEWEGEVNGPIWKNHTYFFFAWFQQQIPLGSWYNGSVPTVKMRNGDFSQFSTAIKDPITGQPFPNKIIPSTRFSDVSKKVLENYVPLPNQGAENTFTNNYGFQWPYNNDLYKGDWPYFRVDHRFNDKNSTYFRWMQRKTPYILVSNNLPAFTRTRLRDHRQMVASDTHVFSPALINSFSFGRSTDSILDGEEEKGFKPLTGDAAVKTIGLQGVNPKNYSSQGFPAMTISGLSTLATASNGGVDNMTTDNYINTFIDVLTWSKGKHILKFGAEYRMFGFLSGAINNQVYGAFNFNGSFSGIGFADFLLGIPYTSARLDPLFNRPNSSKQVGIYVNDSFKVTPKLTIDWGLRWDYYSEATFEDNIMFNWDPKTGNVIVTPEGAQKINPLYPVNTIKVVTGDVVASPKLSNFRPRISAAYRLAKNMVIRGGYGEFTESWGYPGRLQSGGPFQLTESYTNQIVNNAALFTFPNPFPASLASASVPSQSVTAVPMETENGVIRQYNLTMEREFGRGIGIRASYIGSHGSGFNYSLNTNKPKAGTVKFTNSMRPYPQFVSTTEYRTDGLWNYNSLQFEVMKRMGSITFNSNWTWSNNLNNYSITENPYNVTDRWSRDGSNRKHYWVNSAMWMLPFGKGRRYMSNASPIAEQLLGGWTMQGVFTWASGTYFSPAFAGSDPSNTNTSGGLPDRVADGNKSGSAQSRTQWFDPAAFKVPANGTFGNSGGNILLSYPIHVTHLSVAKAFPITERFKLTLTGAFSNLFNQPHFQTMNTTITSPDPGMFTSTRPNYEPEKQSYRQLDLKLRLEW